VKRLAKVPETVARLGRMVSKADLLEAAYWLAAACGESCDDENEALSTLLQELNTHREHRGTTPITITKVLTGRTVKQPEGEVES
jgi:hypothetical protein